MAHERRADGVGTGMHTPREARDGRERESRQTWLWRRRAAARQGIQSVPVQCCSEKNMLNIA